jgi:3-oxoacyl-[acyl-carrier protein] reductase
VARFGRIDIVVNCAGVALYRKFEETDAALFHSVFDTNVYGTVAIIQAALPHLTAPGGRIVNFSSALATRPIPTTSIYSASKAAVAALSHALAKELGPRGITVNTIAPGAVATDFSEGLLRDNENVQQMISSLTPLGRYAVAEDVGGAIAALLGDGNRWVTGQRIEVSGGIHL